MAQAEEGSHQERGEQFFAWVAKVLVRDSTLPKNIPTGHAQYFRKNISPWQ
jgi:hypothetical protein